MFEKTILKLKQNSLKAIEEANDELGIYIPILGANDPKERKQKNWFNVRKRSLQFIKDKQKVLLILGDCGVGKSTFCHNFAKFLWQNYDPAKQHQLIPIFISLPTIKEPNENLIKKALKNIRLDEKERNLILDSKTKQQFIFILDGYDEIHSIDNLYKTNKLYLWNAKVIISCRKEALIARIGNYLELFAPCNKNENFQFQLFSELSVMLFTKEQRKLYLQAFIKVKQQLKDSIWCKTEWQNYNTYKKYMAKIASLAELITSPFLLKIVAEVLPEIVTEHKDKKNIEQLQLTRAKLYGSMLRKL